MKTAVEVGEGKVGHGAKTLKKKANREKRSGGEVVLRRNPTTGSAK